MEREEMGRLPKETKNEALCVVAQSSTWNLFLNSLAGACSKRFGGGHFDEGVSFHVNNGYFYHLTPSSSFDDSTFRLIRSIV